MTLHPITAVTDALAGSDVIHISCCMDDEVALCSTELNEIVGDADEATCVVCADLEPTIVCPKFGKCTKGWAS